MNSSNSNTNPTSPGSNSNNNQSSSDNTCGQDTKVGITWSLDYNIRILQNIFKDSPDIIYKDFNIGTDKKLRAAIVYIEGLIDSNALDGHILYNLMHHTRIEEAKIKPLILEYLKHSSLSIGRITVTKDMSEIIDAILSGYTLLMIDELDEGILLQTSGGELRAVEEPKAETVSRGPRDGFIENLRVNISMVRRKLKSPSLRINSMIIGEKTNTKIAVLHMEGIAKRELVDNLLYRLRDIKTDAVFDSSYLEAFISDNPISPFPVADSTERPDKVAASLLEGRIAILVDGTPAVSIVPATLIQLYQSPEDYYGKSIYATLKRLYRFIGFIIATTLPGLYLALITFHAHLIPTRMLEVLAEGRAEVPFPAAVEVLLMQLMIDLLKEANLRLPPKLSQTIGIVGAIVIGQAAVEAKLVSPAMIIIIAVTTISAHTAPRLATSYPLKFVRYAVILASATLGIYGIIICWIWLLIHLCSLETLGEPYLAPVAPMKLKDLKDTFFRAPLSQMNTRPETPETQDKIRMDSKGRKKDDE